MNSLEDLHFDNRYLNELPADASSINTPRQVFEACYTRTQPARAPQPQLLAYSSEMLASLGLAESEAERAEFAAIFAGNQLLPGMDPYATCYGGHQFGNWAGQLGDGRAIYLGEVIAPDRQRWVLQLKGAGPTPYSRGGDGYAVLRSSVREFLCSEAMFHLGVPTTRAVSLVLSGKEIMRDMFYNGNPEFEPGAVVCRAAPSFVRFGHLEIFAARNDKVRLQQMLDYTIQTDFPHLERDQPDLYSRWFKEVCERTARLMVEWMRVGFVHGVMNTDNMSVLGLTIDYGPYGWLEDFDPSWTPNTTDAGRRRYAYGNQPQMAQWNLMQLGQALYPLIEDAKPLQSALSHFVAVYESGWQAMMASKLGLTDFRETDTDLITDLLQVMGVEEIDMTLLYRGLAELDLSQNLQAQPTLPAPWQAALYLEQVPADYIAQVWQWLLDYQQRWRSENRPEAERVSLMNATNPKYVLRNYLAQQAIEKAEQGDFTEVQTLLQVLRNPYDEQPQYARYAQKRPDWARTKAGCSMLSCSS